MVRHSDLPPLYLDPELPGQKGKKAVFLVFSISCDHRRTQRFPLQPAGENQPDFSYIILTDIFFKKSWAQKGHG